MKEIQTRLALFAAIEGGHVFWSQEIATYGSDHVYKKLIEGGYDGVKYGKTIDRLRTINVKEIVKSIDSEGEVETLKESGLAIVGTRNPTPYGIRNAGDFAAGFVDREWTIISGGAYGIDSAAHKGALIAEGSTVAVLAAGIDVAYPAGNARLFAEICENGALVSEVIPGAHAIPSRFLTRNRIIAALSQATLVVEAAFRSGSLRTARDAAELMRPVMAIPGPISAPTSEGCHRLIGERAAELVTSVADAFELVSTL